MKRSAKPEVVPCRYVYSAETTLPRRTPSEAGSTGARKNMSVSTMTMYSSSTVLASRKACTEYG